MLRKWLVVATLLVIGMAPVSAGSWEGGSASCQQSDLAGTWHIYVDVNGDGCDGNATLVCSQLEVDSNGMIQNNSAPIASDCQSGTVTGGQLNLAPTCVIEGYIETSNGTIYVDLGGFHDEGSLVLAKIPE